MLSTKRDPQFGTVSGAAGKRRSVRKSRDRRRIASTKSKNEVEKREEEKMKKVGRKRRKVEERKKAKKEDVREQMKFSLSISQSKERIRKRPHLSAGADEKVSPRSAEENVSTKEERLPTHRVDKVK